LNGDPHPEAYQIRGIPTGGVLHQVTPRSAFFVTSKEASIRTCNKCLKTLPEDSFHKRIYKSGTVSRQPTCKACKKIIGQQRYTAKKDYVLWVNREWRNANLQKKRAIDKAWVEKNPNINTFYRALQRARKENLVPLWTTEADLQEIKEFYRNCPEGYQVDHIVPMKGKTVRGLHVLNNLQYLTPYENYTKANKLTV